MENIKVISNGMLNGSFSGDPVTQWLSGLGNDRNMQLLAEFWYDDPKGRRWTAPKDSIINGASIPRALWSSIGSPYIGDYRRASVVHDVACNDDHVARSDADEMFYYACLCGGCSVLQAKLLYAGVRIGASQKPVMLTMFAAPIIEPVRLPNQKTVDELETRAQFTMLSLKLEKTGDSFEKTRDVVAAVLKKDYITC